MVTRVVGFIVPDALAAELARPLSRAMNEMTRKDAATFSSQAWDFHDACVIAARSASHPDAKPDASGTQEGTSGKVDNVRGKHVVGVRSAANIRGVAAATFHDQVRAGKVPHRRDEKGGYVFLLENLEAEK
jgi:hypothetical protein